MDRAITESAAWIKLDLLAKGVEIDSSVFDFLAATSNVARRKNFYNTPIWSQTPSAPPQGAHDIEVEDGGFSFFVPYFCAYVYAQRRAL